MCSENAPAFCLCARTKTICVQERQTFSNIYNIVVGLIIKTSTLPNIILLLRNPKTLISCNTFTTLLLGWLSKLLHSQTLSYLLLRNAKTLIFLRYIAMSPLHLDLEYNFQLSYKNIERTIRQLHKTLLHLMIALNSTGCSLNV